MSDDKIDPRDTYVLEETALTKVKSLEELAELAIRETESGDAEITGDRTSSLEPKNLDRKNQV